MSYSDDEYSQLKDENDRNERYYSSAMSEVNRLRGIARNYAAFYGLIKEAYEAKDWERISNAIFLYE